MATDAAGRRAACRRRPRCRRFWRARLTAGAGGAAGVDATGSGAGAGSACVCALLPSGAGWSWAGVFASAEPAGLSEAGRGRLPCMGLSTGEAKRKCGEPSSKAAAVCADGAAGFGAGTGRAGASGAGGGREERAARRAGSRGFTVPKARGAGRAWRRCPAFLRRWRAAVWVSATGALPTFAVRTGAGGGVCSVPTPDSGPCSSSAARAKLAAHTPPAHCAGCGRQRGLAANRVWMPGHKGAGSRARRGSASDVLRAAARRN